MSGHHGKEFMESTYFLNFVTNSGNLVATSIIFRWICSKIDMASLVMKLLKFAFSQKKLIESNNILHAVTNPAMLKVTSVFFG